MFLSAAMYGKAYQAYAPFVPQLVRPFIKVLLISHGHEAFKMPNGFEAAVTNEQGAISPLECAGRRFYGFQHHSQLYRKGVILEIGGVTIFAVTKHLLRLRGIQRISSDQILALTMLLDVTRKRNEDSEYGYFSWEIITVWHVQVFRSIDSTPLKVFPKDPNDAHMPQPSFEERSNIFKHYVRFGL
ncbi:hypothetical protein CTI12_AA539730 [Artemisia annua]|uniref:Uncharacterized protein n=1 Tax=Artemisia annua TaxID=35608 RepID=A0A2U1L205_ARTAN|nr:hypothetical protein CTI12_AA539730 [Artemisia annua]